MANLSSPINTSIYSILTNWVKRLWSANRITRKQLFKNTKTEIYRIFISFIKSRSTRYHSYAVNDKSATHSVLVQIEFCSITAEALSVVKLITAQTIRPSVVEVFFNSIPDQILFNGSDLSSKLMSSGIKLRSFINSAPTPDNVSGSKINDLYRQLGITHIFKIDSKSKLYKTSIEIGLTILQSFRAIGMANFRSSLDPNNLNPSEQLNLDSLLVELPEPFPNEKMRHCANFDSRPISLIRLGNRNRQVSMSGSQTLFLRRKGKIETVYPDRKIGINSLMNRLHRYPVLNLVNNHSSDKKYTQLPSLCIFVPSLKMDGGAEKFITTLMTGLKGSLKSIYLVATDLDTNFSTIRRPHTFSQHADFVYDLEKMMHPEDFANFVNRVGASESRIHYLNIGSQWLYRYLNSYPNQLIGRGKLIDVLFNPFGSLSQHAKVKHSFTDTVFVYSALESYARENQLSAGQLHTVYVGISRENPVTRKTGNTITIGWLGRFSPEKRPEWFIELAKVFKNDARFKMAGTGELLASIRESSFNVPSLEVLGFVNDTKLFLEGINLLVISSEMEGISLSAMEAISSGIPVISTDVGGMSDLVVNGVNGYLVPSNLMSLTSAINAILADQEDFWKMSDFVGSHGLDSKFDENYMIESFKSILN